MEIRENEELKIVTSPGYNHVFRKADGLSMRWGHTKEEDPIGAPCPELLDIEIAQVVDADFVVPSGWNVVDGPCNGIGCSWCYKGNKKGSKTISIGLEAYKYLLSKIPRTVCQIAFGITSVSACPDLWAIMKYTRSVGIIPNVTVNGIGITDEDIKNLQEICGAVAVSVNRVSFSQSIDTVKRLINGKLQVNIHYVLHKHSVDFLKELVDSLPEGFGALVLLGAKDKQGCGLLGVIQGTFNDVVKFLESKKIRFGFDSCSACMYEKSISSDPNFDQKNKHCEKCESGCFSYYINTLGVGYPCSFVEGIEPGINIFGITDFVKDVWHSSVVATWRHKLLLNGRNCPVYKIGE